MAKRTRTSALEPKHPTTTSDPESAGPESTDPIEALVRRARARHRRGDTRASLVLLRQAASLDEYNARVHALLGAALSRRGSGESAAAFRRALWLRSRAGDARRAEVLERLLAAAPTATPGS